MVISLITFNNSNNNTDTKKQSTIKKEFYKEEDQQDENTDTNTYKTITKLEYNKELCEDIQNNMYNSIPSNTEMIPNTMNSNQNHPSSIHNIISPPSSLILSSKRSSNSNSEFERELSGV